MNAKKITNRKKPKLVEYEYTATSEPYVYEGGTPNNPVLPEGSGWRLVSSICCPGQDHISVVWYWERVKQ